MRFSEVPHFILKSFIERMYEIRDVGSAEATEVDYSDPINPDFIFKDRSNKNEWRDTTGFVWSGLRGGDNNTWFRNSYLIGPRTTFVSKEEGVFLELFIEGEDGLFIPIKVQTYIEKIDRDKFGVEYISDFNRVSDVDYTVSETHYDADGDSYLSYEFKIYKDPGMEDYLTNGTAVYFRKDAILHEWIKDQGKDVLEDKYGIDFVLDHYINTNQPFIYLGDIYLDNSGSGSDYNIIYFNIKHFVEKCVPYHQRTSKFKDFLYLAFDILYNEIYQTQKQLMDQIDPIEANRDILDSLGRYYGFDLDILDFDVDRKRWFIKYLPDLIKSKGSYTSLYNIWYSLTHTSNRLNIYERWHDKDIEGDVSEDDYTDYLYTSFYKEVDDDGDIVGTQADFESGAGEEWYEYYYNDDDYPEDFSNKILSTQYIIEGDITDEPINKEVIMSSDITDALHHLWEEFRPINRVANYKLLISPISDFSGNDVSLYSSEYVPYLDTNSEISLSKFDDDLSGSIYIQYIDKADVTIKHGLGSEKLLIEIYDDDLYRVEKDKINHIKIIDDKAIEVSLTEDIKAFVMIRKVDIQEKRYIDNAIRHPFNTKRLLTQFYRDGFVIETAEVRLYKNDLIYVYTDVIDSINDGAIVPKVTRVDVDSASDVWNIEHLQDSDAVLINVFDKDDYKLTPNRLEIVDGDNIKVEFSESKDGYILIEPIGTIDDEVEDDSYISQNSSNEFTITHDIGKPRNIVHVYNSNMERVRPKSIEIIDENNVKVTLGETFDTYTFIKGVDIAQEDDWIINTLTEDFRDVVLQWYTDNVVDYPDYAKINHDEKITVNDDDVNKVVMEYTDYKENITAESDIWEIRHNIESVGIIVNTFNSDYEWIESNSIKIEDENNCTITFDSPQTGYVHITKVGNPSFNWIIDKLENSQLILSSKSDTLDRETYDEIVDISSFREEDGYFYLTYTLPESMSINIKEMGIRDDIELIFYTDCSDMYKPEGFEMNIFYKISKTKL